MINKKSPVVAMLGLTAALSLSATAQPGASASAADASMGDASAAMTGQPVRFSGTVLRYNFGLAGYITAMDVRTSAGVSTVRFAPAMARQLSQAYPVGRAITGTAQPVASMSRPRYDLVSVGEDMGAGSMAQPGALLDDELLKAQPVIQEGSRTVRFQSKLQGLVVDAQGTILALALSGLGTSTGGSRLILVRVPAGTQSAGADGAAQTGSGRAPKLTRDAVVEVMGSIESSPEGSISAYGTRVAASAMTVNGLPISALSLPQVKGRRVKVGPVDASGLSKAEAATFKADGK